MKKIYLVVLSVITFFAVLFGCAYHLYGLLGNKDKSNEMVSVSYDFDNIEKINIDASLVDMNMVAGDKFSVDFSGLKDLLPDVSEDNKTLEIKQHSIDNDTSFNLFKSRRRNLHGVDNVLTITVPSGTELEEIDFVCALGDADITGVNVKKIDVECALGDIDIKDMTADQIYLEADMGDVSVDSADVRSIDATLSMGSFKADLVKDISEYGLELGVSMGECKVDGKSVSRKYTKAGKGGTVKVSCDMGDVNIK